MIASTPKPDRFVSGAFVNGRLVLVRKSGSAARCGVLMCLGALTDNGDATFSLTLSGGS